MNAEQRAVGTCPRTGDPCACDLLDLDICTTPPTPARDERNLFRLAWAEYMLDDVESVYEQWADDCGYDHRSAIPALGFRRPDKVEIEEWSAQPLRHSLPPVDRLLEWVGEWVLDEASPGAEDCVIDADTDPAVIEAFQAALDLYGTKLVGWRQADKLLHTHEITFDDHGAPLLNGQTALPGAAMIFRALVVVINAIAAGIAVGCTVVTAVKGDPDTLLWCAAFYVFVDQARDGAQP